jgi:hypothetical protein
LNLFFASLAGLLPSLLLFGHLGFERRELFGGALLAAAHVLQMAFLFQLPGGLFFLKAGMRF